MIRALLDGLPAHIDALAGYSLGGRIALGMLRLAPQRFRRATIISAHPGLTDARQRSERVRQDQRWIDCLKREGIAEFVAAWERQPLFHSQARLPPDLLLAQRERRLALRPAGLISSLASLGLGCMPSTWQTLADYPGQLRWIAGSADEKFAEIAHQVVALRADTELHILDGIGHNPLLEAPDVVSRLLSAS